MALYLSIVLLATLTALPTGAESRDGRPGGSGIHGIALIGVIWGTTIGLALAHWFAFRLSARVFGGSRLTEGDVEVVLAQVAAVAAVALLCTVPTLFVGDADDVQTATGALGAVVGGACGYWCSASRWQLSRTSCSVIDRTGPDDGPAGSITRGHGHQLS